MAEEQDRLVGWTVEDHLTFDIAFALPRAPVRGLRRSLTEDERRGVAKAILEHLKLCGWEFRLTQHTIGQDTGGAGSPPEDACADGSSKPPGRFASRSLMA